MSRGWQQKTRHYEAGQIQVFKRVGVRGNTDINHSDGVYMYIHTYVCLCIYMYISVHYLIS